MMDEIVQTLEMVAIDLPGGIPVLYAFLLVGVFACLGLLIETLGRIILDAMD